MRHTAGGPPRSCHPGTGGFRRCAETVTQLTARPTNSADGLRPLVRVGPDTWDGELTPNDRWLLVCRWCEVSIAAPCESGGGSVWFCCTDDFSILR